MTLIVAQLFNSGVVMGADSLGAESVIGHPLLDFGVTVEKVSTLGTNIVWGGSGGGGLTQRVKAELDDWARKNAGLLDRPGDDICARLAKVVLGVIITAPAAPAAEAPSAGPIQETIPAASLPDSATRG